MPPRWAARVDGNHAKIVKGLWQIPVVTVADTARAGGGFPDLVVGRLGRNYMLELKNPDVEPARRKLTPDQVAFRRTWSGQYAVVETLEQALVEIGVVAA